MKELILNLCFFVSKKWRFKLITILTFVLITQSGLAQNYSNDTCVLVSTSRMINKGMTKIYTQTNGPVKSILVDNRKWIFDSTGRMIEELNFKDTAQIDRRIIIEYYENGKIKSISLYERSESDEKMPTVISAQELYNWSNDTLTLIELKGVDTLRSVLEVINEDGCVVFSREKYGIHVTETEYEYNLFGLQKTKRFKQWNNNTLTKSFEIKLVYENGILTSKNFIDPTREEIVYRNYHLEDNELKGYLMDSSTLSDSTHTISYNEFGEIIFRQYDDMIFYMIETTKDGVRYKDKIFSYDDGTRKVDRFEYLINGDVNITLIENNEQQSRTTKKQIKDEYGNWIKLITVREQLNKPIREETILREIEYY